MSVSAKSKRICYIRDCGQPVKARGLCSRHHQAHVVRGIPAEQLAPESQSTRTVNAKGLHIRVPEEDLEKLDKAISDGKAEGPRYAWLQKAVLDAIRDL